MVQMQTYLKVADNTGAKELMCFRVPVSYTHLTQPTNSRV